MDLCVMHAKAYIMSSHHHITHTHTHTHKHTYRQAHRDCEGANVLGALLGDHEGDGDEERQDHSDRKLQSDHSDRKLQIRS
jgi:hypothetical protein